LEQPVAALGSLHPRHPVPRSAPEVVEQRCHPAAPGSESVRTGTWREGSRIPSSERPGDPPNPGPPGVVSRASPLLDRPWVHPEDFPVMAVGVVEAPAVHEAVILRVAGVLPA